MEGDPLRASKDNGMTVGGDGKFRFSVDDVQLQLAEPVLDGRRILDEAGFRPAEDLRSHSTSSPPARAPSAWPSRLISAERAARRSWAFKSDRDIPVQRSTIGATSGGLARSRNRSCGASLLWMAMGLWCWSATARPFELDADAIVQLGKTGTERLRVVELVTVYLNDDVEKKIRERRLQDGRVDPCSGRRSRIRARRPQRAGSA